MPRVARIVVPDLPHHLTQRGNNRQDVFFIDEDRRHYLKLLAEQCRRHGAKILGYCLMTNHVHLILIPSRPDSLAKAVGRTHWLYTQYVNRLHNRSGHLWQNRFYSNAMDDGHCLLALRYVERNPIRARICRLANKYPWSSAAAHCGEPDAAALLDADAWKSLSRGLDWPAQLTDELDPAELRRLRRNWHTGRPLAGDAFLAKLEKKLGRRLRPSPVGRPKKPKAAATKRRKIKQDSKK
jgi:putative transposase